VGPSGVGKSSLLKYLRTGEFSEHMDSTVTFVYVCVCVLIEFEDTCVFEFLFHICFQNEFLTHLLRFGTHNMLSLFILFACKIGGSRLRDPKVCHWCQAELPGECVGFFRPNHVS